MIGSIQSSLRRPIVAIMQPTFLPWAGYFGMIALADRFVFLDDVQFVRRSFHHRNKIFQAGESAGWLTIPVKNDGRNTQMNEAYPLIDESKIRKIESAINYNYRQSKNLQEVIGLFLPIIKKESILNKKTISDINISIIFDICNALRIKSEFIRSSSLGSSGSRSEKIREIIFSVGGATYLSADGSFDYMEKEKVFPLDSVDTVFHNFSVEPYPQSQTVDFVSHLSVIDMMFQIGCTRSADLIARNVQLPTPWVARVAEARG